MTKEKFEECIKICDEILEEVTAEEQRTIDSIQAIKDRLREIWGGKTMKNKDGEVIVSCCMTDDVQKYAPCATCMYLRNWVNTASLHEGDPDYCSDRSAVTECGRQMA